RSSVLSLGLGWGAVEIAFVLTTLAAVLSRAEPVGALRQKLLRQARSAPLSPLLGVVERASAMAFHVGATLLVAHNPWSLLALAPVHSGMNLGVTRVARKYPLARQLLLAAAGVALLVIGLSRS